MGSCPDTDIDPQTWSQHRLKKLVSNFLNTLDLYLFLSVNVIIACFCELDISPESKEQL